MRLGDLDKLKENFIKWLPKEGEDFLSDIHPIENIAISAIMEIEEAPTIDPEDLRPKGKWERVIPMKSAAKWSRKVSCSICHREGYDYHRYCPNCGARMEE